LRELKSLLSGRLDRRSFFVRSGVIAGSVFLPSLLTRTVWAKPVFDKYPFSLGVASGDPFPDGVVIWTRLAPEPLSGGGMPMRAVEVEWEVASDERFTTIVKKGTQLAYPELGHSVHVEVNGLEPARFYWYRFRAGDEVSQVGRTKTAPAATSSVARLKLGIAGCQHYETGYYTAFRHLAAEELDAVYHYGDYIYEGRATGAAGTAPRVRQHNGDEIYTVVDYRNRYALYKMDFDLRAAHAAHPFLMSFDDHEVDNNWAGDIDQDNTPKEVFLLRRAMAFQAWYEHMPLRKTTLPNGPSILAYRRLRYGTLAEISLLDSRQYRTDQPCGDGTKARCAAAIDPNATLLGPQQEKWLLEGLGASRARWNILAQQVMMFQLDRNLAPDTMEYSMDKWDGYLAARNRVLGYLLNAKRTNTIVLTGDVHNNWAGDLKADFEDQRSVTLGSEFVATSISSGGDGVDQNADTPQLLSHNPHVKFFNNQRGYVTLELTPDRVKSDYRIVPQVATPGAPINTRASFVVESREAGLKPA
jgi:alkaline phosphatase D